MFLATMVFLAATIVLLALSFRDLLSYKPPTVSAGPVGPPASGVPTGAGPREVVLRLRDMVTGTVHLEGTSLALTPAQRASLGTIMAAVRANLMGPPTAVDEKLEKQFVAVLTPPQVEAIKQWIQTEKSPPDFVQSLGTLERAVGQK